MGVQTLNNLPRNSLLVVDDIIGTGGSLEEGVNAIMDKGALGVVVGCSLPMFVGNAVDKIDRLYDNGKGPLKGIIGTNAIWHGDTFTEEHPWYNYVDLSPTMANIIRELQEGTSMHKVLDIDPMKNIKRLKDSN